MERGHGRRGVFRQRGTSVSAGTVPFGPGVSTAARARRQIHDDRRVEYLKNLPLRRTIPCCLTKRMDTVGQPLSTEICISYMPSSKAQEHGKFEEATVAVSSGNRLANSIRSFNENPWQRCPNTSNVGKRLSSCHLNKQRLINPLEAEVNERARLIESTAVTPPYEISRFHRESPLALRYASATSSALASWRSAVSKPSVNQP
jgi:hypothetical protein